MKTTIVTVDEVVKLINSGKGVLLMGGERVVPFKIEYDGNDRHWVVISDDGEHMRLSSLRMGI